jgi:uncharacterized BrkB/YihY/UPF0761 family membrane protein
VLAQLAALYALVVAPHSLSGEVPATCSGSRCWSSGGRCSQSARWSGSAVIYRYAPNRAEPRWSCVSPGAVPATLVWLAASVGFSIYTANFGRYNETYGALGAVVVVMLWLYIGAYVTVAGAELHAELGRQTAQGTTTGAAPEPWVGATRTRPTP